MNRQGENKMKKLVTLTVLATVVFSIFTGCTKSGFDQESSISVVSREDGSGTRGAFIELFGIEEKAADGTKKDNTTKPRKIRLTDEEYSNYLERGGARWLRPILRQKKEG